MPIYEYECINNKHRFEVIQKFEDPPVTHCTVCGEPVEKLFSSPAIQFKGTGWYITDYARKGQAYSESPESKGSDTESSESKSSESKSSESKPSTESSKTEKSSAKSSKPSTENKNNAKTESRKD
jgi:putative FmdB family regulatory protein